MKMVVRVQGMGVKRGVDCWCGLLRVVMVQMGRLVGGVLIQAWVQL